MPLPRASPSGNDAIHTGFAISISLTRGKLQRETQGWRMRRVTGSASPIQTILFTPNYFFHVSEEIARARSQELSMVCCNLVYFKEAKREA